ncbi:nucleotide exchange factor GrpE [Candidatus Profftella armatura (Diaphorina cf. continua)]|uniref:Protein GrpE n=1 Tax=Candidatus Profftella armatura (Diaphorina cf. continua) TaxID=2661583 RepID=A0A7R6VYR5_9PROT|nr:nucleotide exchange factor GrpE [Candidatus Profftella armatura (Diaphorina cf. continua)]BCG49637.1 nucleotide exchange factor GrpE [Candidatus Profftella armatura (Diaphorina cf. continua)]
MQNNKKKNKETIDIFEKVKDSNLKKKTSLNKITEDELKKKLNTAEMKASYMQDAYLRAKAESENIRRRSQEDLVRAYKFSVENFAKGLLSVKDSLEMALNIETPSIESLKKGVEITLKQLSSVFEKNNLLEINPIIGDKLDPMKHQAVSTIPAEQEPNTIVIVLQKGYLISERLLRPALVTVAQ